MTEKVKKIVLSKLDREEVVIEKYTEFKDSIFNPVYQKTEILLQNIIKENQRYYDSCSEGLPKQELGNIISFEGRRGTGKSSSMRSVQEALKDYKNNDFFKSSEDCKKNNINCYFHVLDIIDASTLEEEENFLEVVLASMFVDLRAKTHEREAFEKNAFELENASSPDKKPLYKRECIYAWLDNIREMRLLQAFGNNGDIRNYHI